MVLNEKFIGGNNEKALKIKPFLFEVQPIRCVYNFKQYPE